MKDPRPYQPTFRPRLRRRHRRGVGRPRFAPGPQPDRVGRRHRCHGRIGLRVQRLFAHAGVPRPTHPQGRGAHAGGLGLHSGHGECSLDLPHDLRLNAISTIAAGLRQSHAREGPLPLSARPPIMSTVSSREEPLSADACAQGMARAVRVWIWALRAGWLAARQRRDRCSVHHRASGEYNHTATMPTSSLPIPVAASASEWAEPDQFSLTANGRKLTRMKTSLPTCRRAPHRMVKTLPPTLPDLGQSGIRAHSRPFVVTHCMEAAAIHSLALAATPTKVKQALIAFGAVGGG